MISLSRDRRRAIFERSLPESPHNTVENIPLTD
jgi:hypothetical protein